MLDGDDDQYEANAEFYDTLASDAWEILRPALAAALTGVDPEAGPIVDIGAGTGLATEVVADTHFTRVQVGDRYYEGRGRVDPTGPETVRWTMTWRVLDEDRVVDERTGVYDWWTVGDEVVTAELANVGLAAVPGGAGLVIAGRSEARTCIPSAK